jgi:hypothetical protein
MYKFLDIFFLAFHTALIFFNLFGWIWKRTRLLNLITLLLTAASWFILGIFYGIGYCPLTDWHWEVLHKLGKYDLPYSYTKYLADRLTGLDFDPVLVDNMTSILFFAALLISVVINVAIYRRKHKRQ